ncbi:class I SAM-dependent methyltransferase [Dactylosporangium sp. NPDC048998]|uniref:class I SAM-dependent methyltransferase n=1 Tax=Dactylosporangium sp. NPDC048998 TaxID=3363976 RepID=UPI003717CF10
MSATDSTNGTGETNGSNDADGTNGIGDANGTDSTIGAEATNGTDDANSTSGMDDRPPQYAPGPHTPTPAVAAPAGSRADAITAFHAGLDGPTWNIAGWGSAELQRVRFEALLRAAAYRGGSVLDWGCGPADLYFHLRSVNRSMNLPVDYTGVDLDPRMVELATSRGAPNVALLAQGHAPEGRYDYVFASGIFQFADPEDPLYYLTILEHMYDISRRAVAVNFLSAQRPEAAKAPDELYVDPAVAARFAAALTDRWVIDHGYHPQAGDFTLALLR